MPRLVMSSRLRIRSAAAKQTEPVWVVQECECPCLSKSPVVVRCKTESGDKFERPRLMLLFLRPADKQVQAEVA